MAEEVHVEVGAVINIGKYSSVKLTMGLTEPHSGGGTSNEKHAAELYDRLEKLMFRKLARLSKRTKRRLPTIGEGE